MKIIVTAFLISFVFYSYSQTNQTKEIQQQKVIEKTIQIKGAVVDSTTQKSIQMAFVMVAGTNIGTLTDQSGKFVINAPQGAKKLAFSMQGYKPKKVDINILEKEIKVELVPKEK